MPNIVSKGKLLPRAVHLPASTMAAFTGAKTPPASTSTSIPDIGIEKAISSTDGETLLIQEITETNGTTSTQPKSKGKSSNSLPGLRGIMKNSSSKPLLPQNINLIAPIDWSWTKEDSGRLRIEVNVPGLVSLFLSVYALVLKKCDSIYHLLIRHAPSPNLPLSTLNPVVSHSPSLLDEPSTSTWRLQTLKSSHASVPSTRQPKHYPIHNKPIKTKKHHAPFSLNDSAILTWMVPRRNGR